MAYYLNFNVYYCYSLLGLLTVTVLPDLLAPKDVKIPDVSGMELDEAIAKLEV